MPRLASFVIVLAAATTADAKPKPKGQASVKVHMDNAAKAHKAGKFDVALEELKAAHAIDPQPKLVFAIAQVYAKLDNCGEAITHYEKFLATTKDKSKQTVVKQAIDACKQKLADKPDKPGKTDAVFRAKKPAENELPTTETKPVETAPVAPKVETTPVAPPVETTPPPEPAPPPPQIRAFDEPPPAAQPAPAPVASVTTTTHSAWYRDPLGDALVITGVGAAVGSFFMLRAAQSDVDKAEASTLLGGYTDYRDSAERKQLYTWAFAGGGLALVTAGVLRYALRDNRRETRAVAIVPNEHGGLITWSGGF